MPQSRTLPLVIAQRASERVNIHVPHVSALVENAMAPLHKHALQRRRQALVWVAAHRLLVLETLAGEPKQRTCGEETHTTERYSPIS